MIDINDIDIYVRGSLKRTPLSSKIKSIYYEFTNKVLKYLVVVIERLDDDEFEELRCSQTDVLSNFPDGEIKKFVIEEYQISSQGEVAIGLESLVFDTTKYTLLYREESD